MAKKKTYYIPTIEIVSFNTHQMMWDIEGSGAKAVPQEGPGAPKRFTPAF